MSRGIDTRERLAARARGRGDEIIRQPSRRVMSFLIPLIKYTRGRVQAIRYNYVGESRDTNAETSRGIPRGK